MALPKKLKSPRLTDAIAAKIKGLWLYSPLNQAQIAAELGALNQGRVSEVLTGQRFPNVAPHKFFGDLKYD